MDRFSADLSARFQKALRSAGVAGFCLAASLCFGQDVLPRLAPPSKWVSPLSFDKRSALADADADASAVWVWLLIDRQFNAQTDEQFYHAVCQVPASAAGANPPPLAIRYDPGCQLLTLHWVRLWRGTNSSNRLDPSKVHFSGAPEPGELLFGTNRTALITLDDVRVGDIIDYAYSLTGSSPALDGKFVGMVPAQLPEPVERLVTKVLWPPSRKLYVQDHGTSFRPTTLRKTNTLEFTWDFRNVPGLLLESDTPSWYQAYPWVQLSEFQTWADVNAWALRWLHPTNEFSPDATNQINRWNLLPDPQDRVLAALRFVQQEIATLAPGGGSSGYEPALPSGVLARASGDPLEKTLLLVALLRTLKFEADPVLVSLRYQNTLANYHPSPTLFDHIVAGVALDGQTFWLDATDQYQRGPLAMRSWPLYGLGLVIHPGTTELTAIPVCPVQPKTAVSAFFSIDGLHGESGLRVVTVAEGADADRLRQHYALTPRDEIDLENLNACAKYYPQIRRTAPTVLHDDAEQNRVETTEFYTIAGLWTARPNETQFRCRLYGVNVEAALERPPERVRLMPWALPFPVHQIFHAEVPIATFLPTNTGSQTIEHPAFVFHYSSAIENSKLFLDYDYRSLSDVVAPDALPSYLQQLNQATAIDGYTLLSLEVP
jgi:hypothetical protein